MTNNKKYKRCYSTINEKMDNSEDPGPLEFKVGEKYSFMDLVRKGYKDCQMHEVDGKGLRILAYGSFAHYFLPINGNGSGKYLNTRNIAEFRMQQESSKVI